MDSFTQPIAVPNTHRLIFTRNVFAPDNSVLADQLSPREALDALYQLKQLIHADRSAG